MVSNTIVRKAVEAKVKQVLDTSNLNFCPRCGMPGFLTQRECWNAAVPHATHHSYYFFGHSLPHDKKKWCYIGKNLAKWLNHDEGNGEK